MKVCTGIRGTTPPILKLGTRWSRVINFRPLFPQDRTKLPNDQGGWLSGSRLLWERKNRSYRRVSKPRPTFPYLSLCTDSAIPAPYKTNFVGKICFRIPSSKLCVIKEYYNRKYDNCVRKKSGQSNEHFAAKSSSLQQGKELSKIRNFMRIVGTEYITFLFIFPYECF
jgi:hypothetical protein